MKDRNVATGIDDEPRAGRSAPPSWLPRRYEAVWLLVAIFVVGLLPWLACHEQLPPRLPTDDGGETSPASPSATKLPRAGLKGRRVLLVHSYHQGYPWVDTVTEGVRSAFDRTGLDLDIFYMDAKRHTDEPWKIDAGQRARKRVEGYRPDVVIAADDDAQQYFATFYVNTALPVVFTGVDSDPSRYGYPASNVTGIIERPHFKQSLALAQRLRPIKRIAVLSCHDSTSILALGFMKQERLGVEVAEWSMADDFDDWKKAIRRFNQSVDAIVIRSYQALKQPGSHDNVDPAEVAAWTSRHASIPTVAFHDFEIRDGVLLGVVKAGQEYGRKAAEYAIRILRGTPPGSLPIIKPQAGVPMISLATTARLGIHWESKLPSEAVFVSATEP